MHGKYTIHFVRIKCCLGRKKSRKNICLDLNHLFWLGLAGTSVKRGDIFTMLPGWVIWNMRHRRKNAETLESIVLILRVTGGVGWMEENWALTSQLDISVCMLWSWRLITAYCSMGLLLLCPTQWRGGRAEDSRDRLDCRQLTGSWEVN